MNITGFLSVVLSVTTVGIGVWFSTKDVNTTIICCFITVARIGIQSDIDKLKNKKGGER